MPARNISRCLRAKKMWSLKRASTAASITRVKGKISGNDLVTVVIKEMLTDGTVINDMEAKDQALTQKLDAYPPVFREPAQR